MNDTASIWSAVAASFSAIAALTIMIIQRKSLHEASKPIVILDDWSRNKSSEFGIERDILKFNRINNSGKGSAYHIYINVNENEIVEGKVPTVAMNTTTVVILPPEKEKFLETEISLIWQNAQARDSQIKFIPIEIKIYCWCSSNRRHETIYRLIAYELDDRRIADKNQVAKNVSLVSMQSTSHSVLKLKFLRALLKIPRFRKLIQKKYNLS